MKERARNLRKKQTVAESKLGFALRDRRFCDYKFRRQQVIGSYIADFVCLKKKLMNRGGWLTTSSKSSI